MWQILCLSPREKIIFKNLCILARVCTIAVCKHKHYSATCEFHCGQWGLKITLERQIRIGSSVNMVPVCFSDWVTWPKTDRQTDRQTDRRRGGWGWSSCCARMTHSVCCLSAHSRSLKDSVTLTSSGPQTNLNVPHANFFIFSRHVFERLFWFLLLSVCLSSPPLVCVLIYLW